MSDMLGIILSLVAAVCYGISAAMQKHAVAKITAKKRFSFRRLLKNARWYASLGVGGIGILAYLTAMIYAPLSTVQVFLSLTLVISVLAGFMFFKERMKVKEWLCVVMIIAGVFLTIL